ncbi:MAG: SPFH domain-containing protein [Polyangiales bacterium]
MDLILFVSVVAFLAVIVVCTAFALLYRKAGPHEALIVYGYRGTRVVRGQGTLVLPTIESCREISLELMSFDVAPKQDLYTRQGVSVSVEAVTQIKVRSDPTAIRTASEQLLTKSAADVQALIRLVLEGHLRGIVGQLSVEEIVKQPELVSDRMRATCADDMGKMGLEVISFTMRNVRDQNNYIENMGRPDVARIKRDADVATAEAERDTAINSALAQRAAAVARAEADQARVEAESGSLTRQAEAKRDLDIKTAEYLESSRRQQAQADKAYEIQSQIMQQQVVAQQVRVEQVSREGQVRLEEIEVVRRERELAASHIKVAEAEAKRMELLADAEKRRVLAEAEGRAAAIRKEGEAEAAVVFMKGEAEANAMRLRADAYQHYNQAAVIDRLVDTFPEVVRALGSSLSSIDRISIVSTGDGDGTGIGKITSDVTKMAAQVPVLFQALSGIGWSDLMGKLSPLPDNGSAQQGVAPPPKADLPPKLAEGVAPPEA